MNTSRRPGVAFYCVADERYFLGAVAMINSLRSHGHDQPLYLLDCGLRERQRALLAPQATLIPSPYETIPLLLNTIAPMSHPAEAMVLIDADMIVTRPLDELIERARNGQVVAFKAAYDRFVPEWGELLDLGPIRRGPYVSGGLLFLAGPLGHRVLSQMDELEAFVELDFSSRERPSGPSDYPFIALDQDVLNAILGSRVEPGEVAVLDYRLAPNQPFDGLRLDGGVRPRCAYQDGTVPYVVHHLDRKPWNEQMPSSIFSRLLIRYLHGPGLAIEVPPEELPPWLRDGARARVARARVDARDRLGWFARRHLPKPIVRRIDRSRREQAFTGG